LPIVIVTPWSQYTRVLKDSTGSTITDRALALPSMMKVLQKRMKDQALRFVYLFITLLVK